jgi:rod shape-determining protein MreD
MRKRDYVVQALIVIICLILQSTFLATFSPRGLIPDLILIVVVSTALIKGPAEGALMGFGAGLGLDLVSSGFVGLHALIKMTLGFFIGLAEEKIFKENLLLPAVVLLAATFIHELLYLLVAAAYKQLEVGFWVALSSIVLPLSLYNALLAPFIYAKLLNWHMNHSRYPSEGKRI